MTDDATSAKRRLTVVLIGAADRRMLPALTLVPQFVLSEAWALHLTMDAEQTHALARAWMALDLDWLPLHIEEPVGLTLADSVAAIIEQEAAHRQSVTVLVPEMDLGRWWQPLLHRGTGRSVAWHLHHIANVTTAVLPVRVEVAGRTSATGGARRSG